MTKPPLILVTPAIQKAGDEFGDLSISVSTAYQTALMDAGAIPVIMAATTSRELVVAYLNRVDGVLMTGGADINPDLHRDRVPQRLRRTVNVTPDGGARDLREVLLVDEIFRQRKPLLAICRGHQMLNVALGGTLVVDISTEIPGALNHARFRQKNEIVHDAQLTPDALLAKITGKRTLGVNSTHHQAVGRPADPLMITGRSGDGIIESMQLKPDAAGLLPFLLSVQFHPERLMDRHPAHRRIFSAFVRACVENREKKL
ncbi:MAG: gamma-glutamyl-gamma-aminobutyrate hydrolase family protein [Verrucomicrobia bacterium]|jgi:putative glutamine amidotransferase|nr:gamma-glutamyl-gamma-aminobutyrate hydrolase family protein [Verrucomicrobiota bacterium]